MPRTPRAEKEDDGLVAIKITKFGDGKVSTGEHIAEVGDVMAKRGDVIRVSFATAESLETSGYAEIEDDASPAATSSN